MSTTQASRNGHLFHPQAGNGARLSMLLATLLGLVLLAGCTGASDPGPDPEVEALASRAAAVIGPLPTSAQKPDDPPNDVNSAHHKDAPAGVVIVAGPDVPPLPPVALERLERKALKPQATVMDVAQTSLALLGLPVGKDMEGRVVEAWASGDFWSRHPLQSKPTHESREWLERRAERMAEGRADDEERLRQLQSLGYIGDEDEEE